MPSVGAFGTGLAAGGGANSWEASAAHCSSTWYVEGLLPPALRAQPRQVQTAPSCAPTLPLTAGWCIFNDQAVAARAAQRDAAVGKVLFVDLDVHQGDGTAAIFQGDPSGAQRAAICQDRGC